MSTLTASELARLERFLQAHETRFALALVRITQFLLRAELAEWVESVSREHGRPFRRFDFTGLKPLEIWGQIEKGTAPGEIALLDGMDSALNETDGQLASLLNRQRERIAGLLPGPVLLVLGDAAMTRFLTDAPDLADWYAANFEFERETGPVAPTAEEHAIPAMSSELIELRIQLLEKQLHGHLPDRTRARVLMELARLHHDSVFGAPADPTRPRTRNVVSSLHAAEAALREAVDVFRRRVMEDATSESQQDLGRALNELALLYMDTGRNGEAEPLLEESIRISAQILEPAHPETLTLLNNLATLLRNLGRYTEAEPLYQRALAVAERVLGPDHPSTLVSVNNLATLYEVQGRYAEAETLCRRALASREKVLGPDHPSTLASLNNLAALCDSQGRYTEAEPLYQRALAAHERVLGPDHPSTLSVINNLAQLYGNQGRYREAEAFYRRALAARERVLGPYHPDTLISLDNLASLYGLQARYAEAEPLNQRALAGSERVLGPEHPDTLISVSNLALLYERQGRYSEAEPLYQRALEGFERVLGAEHPLTQRSRQNLERVRTSRAADRGDRQRV